jgi:chaperonin cofactor prefoldin
LRDGTTTAKTQIVADGVKQARSMLTRIYGVGNVLSMQMVTDEGVTEATKTLSAAELQVKSLADQSKRLNQQAKQLKARQWLQKAQAAFGKSY